MNHDDFTPDSEGGTIQLWFDAGGTAEALEERWRTGKFTIDVEGRLYWNGELWAPDADGIYRIPIVEG